MEKSVTNCSVTLTYIFVCNFTKKKKEEDKKKDTKKEKKKEGKK